MTTFSYEGLRVQQKPDSAPFYLLAAPAHEIVKWADVPRKRADFLAGYQRQLDDRHSTITEFLGLSPENIIPSSVIIAVPSTSFSVRGTETACTVSIHLNQDSDDALLQQRYEAFLARMSDEEIASKDALAASLMAGSELDDATNGDDEDGDDDVVTVESYFSRLAAELQVAIQDPQRLPVQRLTAISEYIRATQRPALILDGQHRVYGAKDFESSPVVLPVVLLPGLAPEEQVFHFYVLNNKAKPLKPTELRSTISTSLSSGEITTLSSRLRQAGVKTDEAAWTHRINTDAESPFRGLIDFGLSANGTSIPENVMFAVAKKILKPSRNYKMLFGESKKWDDEAYRLDVFYTVWNTIRDRYQTAWAAAEVAPKASTDRQLLYKASMLVLTELVLDALIQEMPKRLKRKQPSLIDDLDELAAEVDSALYFLPEEFFTKEWQEKGLDHRAGQEFLRSAMNTAILAQGKNLGNMGLFKKKQKK